MMETVFYHLLSTSPEVTAIVGTKIFPTHTPMGTQFPALSYEVVSRVERNTVSSAESTVHVRYRIQVDCVARDYDTLRALVAAVRKALGNKRGTFVGVEVVTIRPENQSLDVYNEDADFYSRACDFLATLSEPVG